MRIAATTANTNSEMTVANQYVKMIRSICSDAFVGIHGTTRAMHVATAPETMPITTS